jgi:4-amino-4-deoxy-L-arabinose transferase-like glycosyltransferase
VAPRVLLRSERAVSDEVSRGQRWRGVVTSPAFGDSLITIALVLAYLSWLVATCDSLGYTRDEGFYFQAARSYGKWFELLGSDPLRALGAEAVDRYWKENREHPALMKSLFWASDALLHGRVFAEQGTAMRFPAMLLSALGVGVIFAWGRRVSGRAAGLVAALSFAGMPHVFFHAHLACFDMPIVSLWLMTGYAYYLSLVRPGYAWAIVTGLLYGLMLNTKHNAWLMPPALVLHALIARVALYRQGRPLRELWRPPRALVAMALLGPLVLYATWPWIWRDTLERFTWYARFHLQHVYYNMEFLGRTYFEPPFPRAYAWLMTLATVPAITLLLAAIGAFAVGVARLERWRGARREPSSPSAPAAAPAEAGWASLWLLFIVLSYAAWLSNSTPIFGGTKHWLQAYPFIALFAGQGFAELLKRAPQLARPWQRRALVTLLAACVVLAPLLMTASSHPNGLSNYTPLVGGVPGAASLGLNRGFWGHQTGMVTEFIDDAAPQRANVFMHDTAPQSFRMLQSDGRLRRDLRGTLSGAGSSIAIYHHEQHMSRVEHMIWTDYGTTRPAIVGTLDGVPLIWVYVRPEAP